MEKTQQYLPSIQLVAKFLTGIAGITVGGTTFLSILGFMVLRSHADLLGVSNVLHHSLGDYLYAGGDFIISTLFLFLPSSIIGNMYAWLVAGIIAFYLLGKRGGWWNKPSQRLKRLKASETFQQDWVIWVILLSSSILLIIFLNYALSSTVTIVETNPGTPIKYQAKDLLFAFTGNPELQNRQSIEKLEALKVSYRSSVFHILFSSIVLWGIYRIFQHSKNINVVFAGGRLLLYLLFLTQLSLLPVNYGKIVYPNRFHRVSMLLLNTRLQEDLLQGEIEPSQNVYLLNERPNEFVFYFGDSLKISLIKKDDILNITVGAKENVFARKAKP